jgi:alpha-1,2-mannosyltransferase
MMVGLATAIKLTPGIFVPYLWLTGRRRAAVVASLWFIIATGGTAIAMPQASKAFWTQALLDSSRVGDNAGTPNQSLRSIFLRSLPGPVGTVLWLLCALVVAIVGFHWAREASRAGEEVRGMAIAGMLAVLLSPVAWIHHLAGFIPLMIGGVLGDGRDRRRIAYAVLLTLYFTFESPWWGQALFGELHHLRFIARILQDSFAIGALVAVWLMGRLRPRTAISGA